MAVLGALLTITLGLALWSFVTFIQNYISARQIGLPLLFSPVQTLNPVVILYTRYYDSLPHFLGRWTRCTFIGWPFQDKRALHDELGNMFILVSPGKNELMVADPVAALSIMNRRKDFIKPPEMEGRLDIFGPSVNGTEGDVWVRHRRVTAPAFSEKLSDVVWAESIRQAGEMLDAWLETGAEGTRAIAGDATSFALHVLSKAAMGAEYSFRTGVNKKVAEGRQLSYGGALQAVLGNVVALSLFPDWVLVGPWSGKNWKDAVIAKGEFQLYMEEQLANEKSENPAKLPESENLIAALLKASEETEKDGSNKGLSDREIYGNIFFFTLAGHETTANAITFSIVLLAANPEWQDWLSEEITRVCGNDTDPSTWSYSEYPRLRRCLSIMLETLRLYGSIVQLPKKTPRSQAQMLPASGGRQYLIPEDIFVTVNNHALQCDPKGWPEDNMTWRPDRWTRQDVDSEHMMSTAVHGYYMPFALGPRGCLGQKFARVEEVALLARIFRGYRVRPVLSSGESFEIARKRLMDMAEDSCIRNVTVQMNHPEKVPLVWERR